MSNKSLIIAMVALIVAAGGVFVYRDSRNDKQSTKASVNHAVDSTSTSAEINDNESLVGILNIMNSIKNLNDATDVGTTSRNAEGGSKYSNSLYGISLLYPASWHLATNGSLRWGSVDISNYDLGAGGRDALGDGENKVELGVGPMQATSSYAKLDVPDYPAAKQPVVTTIIIAGVGSLKITQQLDTQTNVVNYIIPIPHTNSSYALSIGVHGDKRNFGSIES